MRISDCSSDVCSSDLGSRVGQGDGPQRQIALLPDAGAPSGVEGGCERGSPGQSDQHQLDRRNPAQSGETYSYQASKAALIQLTKRMAARLAEIGRAHV